MFDHLDKGRWWDVGLQLVEGCSKVSPGCDNCWSLTAANMRRFNPNPKTRARYAGTVQYAQTKPQITDTVSHFAGPPIWTGQVNPQWDDLGKIGSARTPQVYTFWNDLFHEKVEEEFITSVMLRIIRRPQHFYIVCTKRPERALEYFNPCYPDYVRLQGPNPFKNRLMIMTTAENQAMADRRVPILLQIPGVLHGVSVEPGLGVVDLRLPPLSEGYGNTRAYPGLDWIICGGETGPHARPMHPDIPRKLRDDCVAAGVPFFFKSWGKWEPFDSWEQCCQEAGWGIRKDLCVAWPSGVSGSGILGDPKEAWNNGCRGFKRVGKKAAGRTLDEGYWDEVPHGL